MARKPNFIERIGMALADGFLREAVGVPKDWMLGGHVVVGWPRGRHGPVRRRPVAEVSAADRWDQPFLDGGDT